MEKTAITRNLVLFLLVITLVSTVLAIPPIPTEFYGTATIYNLNRTPLPIGTVVNIFAEDVKCGSFTISNSGYYGSLSCLGDDNYTIADEGATHGQNIIFKLANETAQTFGDTVWYNGEFHMVNITPIPLCPNTWCELTESCITCAEDCGVCPANQSTGNTTGGGGGGGTGGGSGGSGSITNGGLGGTGYTNLDIAIEVCQENWICTDWQPEICPIEELQTRDCRDENNCSTEYFKPELNKTCEYIGTCFDSVKNQDETDKDCGGQVCEPCDLGKKCLFDFDCKTGFCDPIDNICALPTCTDGFQNQGEGGVDCDGPCPPCVKPTLEKPETIMYFFKEGCGSFPWIFLAFASLFALLFYLIGKGYIKYVKSTREYQKLDKIERMTKLYNLNRDINAFSLIMILLEIAVVSYMYYFCEIVVWIFLMLLLIVPLIIAVFIKHYVYDEKRKNQRLYQLLLKHEDYLNRLIQIERQEIRKEEKKSLDKFDSMNYKQIDEKLALQLKDIRYLIEELQQTKENNPFELENSLADNISSLSTYNELIDADEELKEFSLTLKLIEKIHRDIVVHFKELRENEELKQRLKEQAEQEAAKNNSNQKTKEETEKKEETGEEKTSPDKDNKTKSQEKINTSEKNKIKIVESEKKETKVDYNKIKTEFTQAEDKEGSIKELLEKFPDNTVILFMIASYYHRTNNLKKAEDTYLKIISHDPKYKPALYYLASLYNQQKRTLDSYRLYKKIVHLDSGYQKAQEYYNMLKTKYEPLVLSKNSKKKIKRLE